MTSPSDNVALREALDQRGWVVAPSLLATATIARLNAALETAIADCDEMKRRLGQDTGSEGVAHHVLGLHAAFVDFTDALPLQSGIEEYLGGNIIINSFGGFAHRSGTTTYAGAVHRDIRTYFPGRPMMVNMLVMLDEFSSSNGATLLLSGSHRRSERPDDTAFFAHAEPATGPAGSVLVFDSRLWHASGENRSGATRRALTLTITRPFMKQQMDYPRLIGYDRIASLTPNQIQVIGYNARVPASHEEWYQPPERRMHKPGQG
jgi:hypothetical protein